MENSECDFKKMCRICTLYTEDMRSIFENDCPRIDEMLMACTTLVVDYGDGLPESICTECRDKLSKAYTFKQLCEATDVCLREYLASKDTTRCNANDDVKEETTHSQYTEADTSATKTDSNELDDTVLNENDIGIKGDPEDQTDMECLTSISDYIQLLDNNQLLLTCRTCSKCFTTLDGLKCHKRIHTGSLFKCNTCDKQYTRQNHLQRHELTHGRRKVHVCKICNKTLTRFEHLKRHLVTHLKEKPFSCTTCNRGFNRSEHLNNHVKRCKGDFVHVCDICNKGFNRADSLDVHKHLHDNKMPRLPTVENLDNIEEHYVEIEYNGPEDELPPFSDESESETDHEHSTNAEYLEPQVNIAEPLEQGSNQDCTISDVAQLESVFGATDGVYAELDTEELAVEKIKITEEMKFLDDQEQYDSAASAGSEYLPKKRIKRKRGRPRKNFGVKSARLRSQRTSIKIKNEPNEELLGESEEYFKCHDSECSETFTKKSLLEKHIVKHEDSKLHTCDVCNKSFSRHTHLKRHMVSHSELKPFSCEFCKKRFNRRDHLTQHMKLHVRAQEFECEVCKKIFGRVDHLAKHKASKHDIGEKNFGEKKYQCSVCFKSFTTEKYRDIHIKAHMGDKNYICRICEKSFVSKSHLTEHIKFHNEHSKKFLCSECGQRFIRNDYLVIHMRRHRGEKPFKCRYCGKGFPRTTDLTVHERYHTGEKTHLCTICGRGFGRAYNLTVHMRTHTGEKPYQCTYCDAAFAQGNDLKAHVRRHTGERFHCDFCSESFLMGYLLTHHKRTVHGMNIVSNIRRLNPVKPQEDEEEPPVMIPLPTPVVPTSVFNVQLQAQLAMAQLLGQNK